MKSMLKRVLSMALAIVMVIGLIPAVATHVHAATIGGSGLTDTTIGLSATDPTPNWKGDKGTVTWTANGTDLSCVATGNGGIFKVAADSTLTITNNGESGKLAFDWTLTGDGSVSGIITATSGSYSADLANGASTSLTVKSTSGNYTCTLTISNLRIIRDTGAITSKFLPGENGSYTVDGTAITEATELSKSATESYAMVATPASGYQFFGWYNETTGKYFSYSATTEINLDTASTIKPVFVSNSTAIFGVGVDKFADLNEANTAASSGGKLIVLLNNGTLAAGDYTISSGNTLLVPYNSSNTVHTEGVDTAVDGLLTDTQGTYTTPYAYRTLTMASGANITVNGALNVGGEHHAGSSASNSNGITGNSAAGSPTGPVGFINMASGSTITVQSGGNLYAWGFITGSGSVTAKSGAAVHENMQIADFRGGTATTAIVNNADTWKFFPFSQYFVQNIEVPLTLEKGATEYATTTIYMSSNAFSSEVKFIGDGALFTISNGSVTKAYDGSKDRLNLTVNGTVGISSMELSVSTMTINSGAYVLPITNNITINVNNGSVVNLTQDMALLPGAQVNVAHGASLNVPSGYNMYIYDGDQWGVYVFSDYQWIPVPYAPSKTYTRTQADVTADVKVDLNGALTVTGGAYTTAGGANVYSSEGTGSVTYSAAAGTATVTYQTTQSGSDMTAVEIPITSVKLHNGNGNYTETADAVAGDTYYWNSACNKWTKNAMDEHTYESKVIDPTCTTEGYTAQTCIYCDHEGEHTDIVPATGHSNNSIVTAPTCTEQGYTTHTCTVCGNVQVDTYVAATGHTFVAGTVVAPTCTAQGYTVYSCSCGATENRDYVDAAGHSYNAVVTAPTCTAKGYTTYTCACGDSYVGDEVNALGHTEVTVAGTPATCTATGLTDGKACSVCGTTTVAQEVIPMLPHTEVVDVAVAATCTATGLTEGKHCEVCGTVTVAQTEVAALGHTWDEGVVTDAPDCNNAGVMTYTCGTCGDTRTEAIDATGHTEVVDAAVAPTCTTTGLTEGKHCSVCGTVTVAQTEVAALGHTYETVVTAPTCGANGYTTYTCHCGDSYVADEVAALGHNWVILSAEPATCTEDGFEKFYCENCNETSTTVIPATGHNWGEEVVVDPTCTEAGYTKKTCTNDNCGAEDRYDEVSATGHAYDAVRTEPTCTVDGSVVYTCNCGDTYTETITATGHTYESVVTEPTCTEQGYTTYTCHCGDSYVDDYVDAAGHDYTEFVETVEPTCTEGGYTVYKCECGETENRDFVDALDHDYESVVTAPTCLTDGYTTHSCSRCDSTYIDSKTEATGHAMGDWYTVSAATCVNDGEERRECANCDHYETNVLPASGHTEETVASKEPTCTETGLTEGTKCSVCGETLTEQEEIPATGEHDYVDGKCDMCGEADPDAIQITCTSKSLILKGMTHIKMYWGFPGLTETEVKDLVEDAYMVVTKGDGSTYQVGLTYNGVYKGVQECYALTEGIPAKNMIDIFKMQAFVVVDGKTYASEEVTYGVQTYCEGRFEKSKDEDLKSALVALMNYGAAAQIDMKYNTDNLLNAKLEEYVEKFGLNAAYLDLNWQDSYLTVPVAPSAEMMVNFGNTETLKITGKSLYLKGAIAVNYYVSIGNDDSKFQDSTATMYFWTEANYKALEAAGTALTKENANYFVEDGTLSDYSEKYGYEYAFVSDQIAAKNLGDTIYCVMVVTDSEGIEHCSEFVTYSPEVYASNKINDGKVATIDDLCKWMVVYGERAKVAIG